MKPERADKYFICEVCSKAKGWELPDWNITVHQGLCGWCKREDEAVLIPVVDFKGKDKRSVWD